MNRSTKYLLAACTVTIASAVNGQVITSNIQGNAGAIAPLAYDATTTPIAYIGTAVNNLTVAANNAVGFNGGNTGMIWTDGTASTIDVALNIGSPAVNFNGGFASGTEISKGYAALHGGFGPDISATVNSYSFTGLNDALTYDFAFIAQGDTAGQGATISLGMDIREITGQDTTGTTGVGNVGITYTIFEDIQSTGGAINFGITTPASGTQSFIALNGFQIAVVPESGTYAMLAGLAALCFTATRRRK